MEINEPNDENDTEDRNTGHDRSLDMPVPGRITSLPATMPQRISSETSTATAMAEESMPPEPKLLRRKTSDGLKSSCTSDMTPQHGLTGSDKDLKKDSLRVSTAERQSSAAAATMEGRQRPSQEQFRSSKKRGSDGLTSRASELVANSNEEPRDDGTRISASQGNAEISRNHSTSSGLPSTSDSFLPPGSMPLPLASSSTPANNTTTTLQETTSSTRRRTNRQSAAASRTSRRADKLRDIQASVTTAPLAHPSPLDNAANPTDAAAIEGQEQAATSRSSSRGSDTHLSAEETATDTSAISDPPHNLTPTGRFNRRNQRRREEKLRDVQASMASPQSPANNDSSTPTQLQHVIEASQGQEPEEITNPDNASGNDVDDFAERILQQNTVQNQQATTLKNQFQIDVMPHTTNPESFAEIHITGPDMRGLLTIILMALDVQGWNVVEVIKKKIRASNSIPTTNKAANSNSPKSSQDDDPNYDESKEPDNEQEVDGDDRPRTNGLMEANLLSSSLSVGLDPNADGKQCIVVQYPTSLGGNCAENDRLLQDLQRLLTSACQDFTSPRRSLQPLVQAFENTIEPNNNNNDNATRTSNDETTRVPGPPNLRSRVTFGGKSVALTGRSSTAAENRTRGGILSQSLPPGQFQPGADLTASRPGAYYTMGRAFGAPVRQSVPAALPDERRSIGERFRSFRRRISDGIRSIGSSTRHLATSTRRLSSVSRASSRRIPSNERTANVFPIASEVVPTREEEHDAEALEADIRKRIVDEAAAASLVLPVATPSQMQAKDRQRRCLALLFIITVLVIGIVVGATVPNFSNQDDGSADERPWDGPSSTITIPPSPATIDALPTSAPVTMVPSASPTEAPLPTLLGIIERGFIRCSVGTGAGLGQLETALCEALAAAVLGNSSKIEFVDITARNRFRKLKKGEIDVLIRGTTHTISRALKEQTTGSTFSFSSPYFFDGMVFGGLEEEYVACANHLDTYFGPCRGLLVCVLNETTHHDFLLEHLPQRNLHVVETHENVLRDGKCNAIADESLRMRNQLTRASGVTNQTAFFIGTNSFTKEPLAMVTRSEDVKWAVVVETVLQGLLEAEVRNVSSLNAYDFPNVSYAGSGYERMVARAVESVGNFGEIYDRSVGTLVPKTGLNLLRTDCSSKSTGLIYGFPFGKGPDSSPLESETGKIADILNRESFQCGVPIEEEFRWFQLEICKALSAALFGSDDQFEEISFSMNSLEPFGLLSSEQVDIISGVGVGVLPELGASLQNYVISKPFLFDAQSAQAIEACAMATSSNDQQWAMFAQWVVMSMILAEEKFFSKERYEALPETDLFGPIYNPLFLNIISKVGNYGEIFKRTIKTKRSGCNLPNLAPHGPQHFPFLFEGL